MYRFFVKKTKIEVYKCRYQIDIQSFATNNTLINDDLISLQRTKIISMLFRRYLKKNQTFILNC